mgnify:CR=1 FL=1
MRGGLEDRQPRHRRELGGMARFLNGVRTRRSYRNLYLTSLRAFDRMGGAGRAIFRGVRGGTQRRRARYRTR